MTVTVGCFGNMLIFLMQISVLTAMNSTEQIPSSFSISPWALRLFSLLCVCVCVYDLAQKLAYIYITHLNTHKMDSFDMYAIAIYGIYMGAIEIPNV